MGLWGLFTTYCKASACRHLAVSEGVVEIISMTKMFSPPGMQLCENPEKHFQQRNSVRWTQAALRLLQLIQLDCKENRKTQGPEEDFTILWARCNYSEMNAGCKKFQLWLKQFSLRHWGTQSVANRCSSSTRQSKAVITEKKISYGNCRCSLLPRNNHRAGDDAASELFHSGDWHNQKMTRSFFNSSLSTT